MQTAGLAKSRICGTFRGTERHLATSAPEEVEADVLFGQLLRAGDQVVGVRGDDVQQSSVPNIRLDDAGFAGDADGFSGFEQRLAESPGLVDEVQRERLFAGPDLAGGQGLHLFGWQMAAGRYIGDELTVHVIDQRLEIRAFFRSHLAGGIARILERAGVDHFGLQLRPLEQVAVIGPLHNDSDGADDAGLISVDLVRRRGDVISAAGPDAFHGSHDGLLLLVADAQDFVVNLLRGRGGSAWRIDVQDDGLDGVVLIEFAQLINGGVGREDDPVNVHYGDVAARKGCERGSRAGGAANGQNHKYGADEAESQEQDASAHDPRPNAMPARRCWRRRIGLPGRTRVRRLRRVDGFGGGGLLLAGIVHAASVAPGPNGRTARFRIGIPG